MRQRMASSSYFDEQEPNEPFHCTICMTELPRWPADACTLQPCGHHFHLESAAVDGPRSSAELQSWVRRWRNLEGLKEAVGDRGRAEEAVGRGRRTWTPGRGDAVESMPSEGTQRDGL